MFNQNMVTRLLFKMSIDCFHYYDTHVGIVPVLRMSPAPGEQDLSVMDDREGICDLYDIGHTNGLD